MSGKAAVNGQETGSVQGAMPEQDNAQRHGRQNLAPETDSADLDSGNARKAQSSRIIRLWLALGLWAAGLVIMAALSWQQISALSRDAENRLIGDAGRTASQLSALLSLPGVRLDTASARALVAAAMEDDGIYAIQIQTKRGVTEGQRRNYLWEPVPWDDEIAENCAQGMSPIRVAGHTAGKVEVWLSPRINAEEESMAVQRENLRLGVTACLWTAALLLLLWHWGEFKSLGQKLSGAALPGDSNAENNEDDIVLSLAKDNEDSGGGNNNRNPETPAEQTGQAPELVNGKLGRQFQCRHPGAWLVTAGMFRQTFGRAPALISRLYAGGELAGLCHLGRMLEQAAPCVGARPLEEAAREMQASLNDPHCKTRALPVEKCARILEQTLEALGGKKQAAATPQETEEIS